MKVFGRALIRIVFVILSLSCVLSFIFAGRGARMREGKPKKEGRRSFVAYLPSLLGFPSRALLFLTLSSLFGSTYTFGFAEHRESRDQESGGTVLHFVKHGENLRGKGDRSEATTPCLLGLSPPNREGAGSFRFSESLLGVIMPANSDLY